MYVYVLSPGYMEKWNSVAFFGASEVKIDFTKRLTVVGPNMMAWST